MKVATFGQSFKLTLPNKKELTVIKNKKYIFSDFVLKQFVDSVVEKGGMKAVKEMVKTVEDINAVFPVLDLSEPISELKKVTTLIIIRTGGIGDLLALSNVAKLATHIFRDILKVSRFRVFFITDQKYAPVFKYFDQMVTPIYYFHDPIDKILKKYNIFGSKGIRSIYFEGLIEEREDNWFDLQLQRLNFDKFELKDQIAEEYLVKNPKLVNIFEEPSKYNSVSVLKKNNADNIVNQLEAYREAGIKTVLIHHRASAWIRSFNLSDTINSLYTYFKRKDFDDYKIIVLPRNYTKSDTTFFDLLESSNPDCFSHIDQIITDNLHQFFYIISTVDLVISSDTAAFHFKEGIGGKAIGIYSSFPSRMRTKTYVNTHSYDIMFPECKFISDSSHYIGCVSHFKTPYEVCVHVADKYKQYFNTDHHFKRGNRIPDKDFCDDLENFVKNTGMEALLEEGIFQYAPCLSSHWNKVFVPQLLAIYEREKIVEN